MKTSFIKNNYYLLAVVLLLTLFSCTGSGNVKPSEKAGQKQLVDKVQIDSEKEMESIIAEAVGEAKQKGNKKVHIFLDEDPDIVQTQDLVSVRYSAVLETGDPVIKKGLVQDNIAADIIAGRPAGIPGLGPAVLGMRAKEKKTVVVEPKNAFGEALEKKIKKFPRTRTMPLKMAVAKEDYIKRFKSLPSVGDRIRINPYFESEVLKINDTHMLIKNFAKDGMTETAPFGTTTVKVVNEDISITLTPEIGADFYAGQAKGTILSSDDQTFEVDFNHPYAGKKITLDIEVKSFIKGSVHKNIEMEWIEGFDEGLEKAMDENKNMVLVLYADWCKWCKKLLGETFDDPRIKLLKDNFVWAKANSDKDESLKVLFEQHGFPMIVLTTFKGQVIKKIEGYKDAEVLLIELERIMKLELAETD